MIAPPRRRRYAPSWTGQQGDKSGHERTFRLTIVQREAESGGRGRGLRRGDQKGVGLTQEVAEDAGTRTGRLRLWSDDPAEFDLLAFSAISSTIVDALLDDDLDPLAIGLSGSWGSGKTTILRLISQELTALTSSEETILVVSTDPWRYDPTTGVKETLIGEVLSALSAHLTASKDSKAKALELLGKLARRVDWARALRIAAKGALAFQVPTFDEVVQIVRPPEDETAPGLDAFRSEFQEFMESHDLRSVRRVVVLVDDLDRCLDESIVDTLEAIRLFLAVPKMSFVIAADEERVADAIRPRFGEFAAGNNAQPEEPAKLYLHKIVQTTVPIPALSRFDTEAYLVLLQILTELGDEPRKACIERCAELRQQGGELDELAQIAGKDISGELLFAARLTPILYEKLRGNPRRIKRFLNDLNVRQSIANRRGIDLEPEVIAKLMVVEVLLPDAFDQVLGWLARNELRDRIIMLEAAAGRSTEAEPSTAEQKNGSRKKVVKIADPPKVEAADYDADLLRWAKLPPALAGVDLAPYLHLAAAFTGQALLDEGLPPQLRDLAANLASSVRAEQKSVTQDDLSALTQSDALTLARHLARVARDRPSDQVAAILGFLRIVRLHEPLKSEAAALLKAIPGADIEPATALLFEPSDMAVFQKVLEGWTKRATAPTKNAIAQVLPKEGV